MLIHRMLPVSRTAMFSHLVVSFGLISLKVLLVAVKIFGPVLVPLVLARVFVPMFFAVHSCSLGMMFSRYIPRFVFTFSRSSSACGSNALCALAMLLALIE